MKNKLKYIDTFESFNEKFSIRTAIKIIATSIIPLVTASCSKNDKIEIKPTNTNNTQVPKRDTLLKPIADTSITYYKCRFIVYCDSMNPGIAFYYNTRQLFHRDPFDTKTVVGDVYLYSGDSMRFEHPCYDVSYNVRLELFEIDTTTGKSSFSYQEDREGTSTENMTFIIK